MSDIQIHNVAQGSPEWLRARMGKPTASQFHRIMTPSGKSSSQAGAYMYELVAELILGAPLEHDSMPWMDRGKSLEEEARRFYEFQRDIDIEMVGLVTAWGGTIGASPDGFAGADGLIEIKCPRPSTHVAYLYAMDSGVGSVDKDYMIQAQGQMLVTGRQWVDILSYCPGIPEALIRVPRDEETQKALTLHLRDFVALLAKRVETATESGWIKPAAEKQEDDLGWLGISDDDVTAMLAGKRGII